MGGTGSGRYGGRRLTTIESMRLDINWLARKGILVPGRISPVHWRVTNGRPLGKIYVAASAECVVLLFRTRVPGSTEWRNVRQRILLNSIRTNFEGTRKNFACPKCQRACRDLFAGRDNFVCRRCLHLAYLSQHQRSWERAGEQARVIARRLSGRDVGNLDVLPPKPCGMRWSTYKRLSARHDQLTEIWRMGVADMLAGDYASPDVA